MTDDKATPAVTSLTIRSIERDLERTPSGRGGIIRHDPAAKGAGASGTPGDNLLADWRELETALAAERDRADRAELELDAVTSLDVDHFTDIWDSLPRVSYTTRVAMAQAAVDLIKQATA